LGKNTKFWEVWFILEGEIMSDDTLIEILTAGDFRRFQARNLGVIEYKQFDDGVEFKATDCEWYFLPLEYQQWCIERATHLAEKFDENDQYANNLIYGADKTKNVVSIEVKDNLVYIYTETPEGVKLETRPFKRWILTPFKPTKPHTRLAGDLHFKYLTEFDSAEEKQEATSYIQYRMKKDLFTCYDEREAYMIRHGMTYFKGMSPQDVSILSFDIETNKTLDPTLPHAKTLLISNTFRKLVRCAAATSGLHPKIERKLFALDEYKNELSMILAWCEYVREIDPSIITGHNNFGFDLYYLQNRLKITQKTQIADGESAKSKLKGLPLGRDGSAMKISPKVSQFRKDGSQSYDYHKTQIFGREIIDGFFMSIRYDIGRDFPSYGLKPIVEHLGLEKEGRIKWDFEKDDPAEIYERRNEPEFAKKWAEYKEYCIDDADDSLKLFDLMIGAAFFASKNVPMAFQTMYESASGSQLNKMLIRGYLQNNHGIPKPEKVGHFKGAISLGMPGVYTNVFGLDFSRLYPSIIMQWEIFDKKKDPLGLFLEMTRFFALERDKVKEKYNILKSKKDRTPEEDVEMEYLYNLQNSMKVMANSCYGMNGTGGLHFNSEKNAAFITEKGRELFEQVLVWATGEGEDYWREQL
jgi:DNA polymerase elongation subunit (family B)